MRNLFSQIIVTAALRAQPTQTTQTNPYAAVASGATAEKVKRDPIAKEIHHAACYYEQWANTRKPYFKLWCDQSLDHAELLINERKQTSLDPQKLAALKKQE